MTEIYFDGRFINPTSPDGITRFSIGLIGELNQLEPITVLVSEVAQIELLPSKIKTLMVNKPTSARELTLATRLNKTGVKVLFSPMQTTSSLGRKFKLVLTLHDMIYYRHRKPPAGFSALVRLGWYLFHLTYIPQRLVLNRSDLVVTVSETSKKQILQARLTKRPVEVIYNAGTSQDIKPRIAPESKDIVYMGSFIDYKNVEFLVQAMSQLVDYRLILLSRISQDDRKRLEGLVSPNRGEVIFKNGVTEAEYQKYLATSFALVSASKDEGFGIPLVEAMSHGLPVVVSAIEIFREVASTAGLYFDNEQIAEFVEKIHSLEDPKLWEMHSNLGVDRVREFSWVTSAAKLHQILKSLT